MKKLRPLRARHAVIAWLVIYFPWLPGYPLNQWLPSPPTTWVIDSNTGLNYALVAFSLVILTGWVGQISLGQGAFVGIGAFTTAILARSWGIPFPANLPLTVVVTAGVAALLGVVALRVRGLYLAVATLIFAWMCDAWLFAQSWFIGSGGSSSIENRVIGQPGTATVFDFSNPRTMYLVMLAAVAIVWYAAVNLRNSKTGRAFFALRGSEVAAVSLGIDVIRYKLLAFALSGGIAGIAGNLLITDLRTTSPVEFQFTVSLFYLGVAVIGGLASLGGAVAAGLMFGGLTEVFFRVSILNGWLDVVTVGLLMAVLLGYPGGLGALGPATIVRVRNVARRVASLTTAVRGRVSRRTRHDQAVDEHVPAPPPLDDAWAGVYEPEHAGDLPALPPEPPPLDVGGAEEESTPTTAEDGADDRPATARRRFRIPLPAVKVPRWRKLEVERHSIDLSTVTPTSGAPQEVAIVSAPESLDWRTADTSWFELPKPRESRKSILTADHVVVRFGGLTAVDNVSIEVREHEIVGLIGPNGAGKTTTFNAIAGLNEPTSGTVSLFGKDATDYPVHLRAQMGVGRTFQLIQLFPQLTVFDNLLVATHVHNPTGVFSHLLMSNRAILAEARARRRVRMVIDMLGLQEFADRRVAGLPFGILRQVEIARALVTESPLLMLDEPASGLDNAETDELAQLLRFLRSQVGVTILLIEHDVRMVVSVCDYIYAINRGAPLADGTPAEIQRNADVVAAYLGQSEDEAETPVPTGARG